MESVIITIFCGVFVIPLLSKILWSHNGVRKYIKKLKKRLQMLNKKHTHVKITDQNIEKRCPIF